MLVKFIPLFPNFFFRNTSCFPVILNPHRDEIVARLTEERVPSVNHEVVPDYFRTKPDPAVEALQKELNKDSKFKKLNSNDLRELILT